MAEIKRTMIASLLIEQAGEMKHKRPNDLDFEDLIDVVQAVVKKQIAPIVVAQSGQQRSLDELKDFAYEVCPLHRQDDLEKIISNF